MKKIISPWNKTPHKKKQITFRFDAEVEQQIKRYWKKEYGLRGRAKWVSDAVQSFLKNISYLLGDFSNPHCERAATFSDLVSASARPKKLSSPIQLSLPENILREVDIATKKLSLLHGESDGHRSAVIRAAIRWHLEDKKQKGLQTKINNDLIRIAAKRGEKAPKLRNFATRQKSL